MQSVKVEFSTPVESESVEIRATARRLLRRSEVSYVENRDADCWDVTVTGESVERLRGEFYAGAFENYAMHGLVTATVDGEETSTF